MRHNNGLKKLNRTSSHRKALLKNMAISLIKHEQIKTTLPKARVLRPFLERLITVSKTKNLHSFRKLYSVLRDRASVTKLLDDLGPRSATRPGGYTRIYKFGFRYGDSAPMALIELVDKSASTTNNTSVEKKASKRAGAVDNALKTVSAKAKTKTKTDKKEAN